ncbi:sensor histidine kinase [Streptomyces sp. NPDC096205]|uniref:sensor histidine kinase n=1 Tax=Streptomyces sp. NPDC096205 TaxID=3366081 RepID=UPI0037F7E9B8
MAVAKARDVLVAGAQGLGLAVMGWTASIALTVLTVVSIVYIPLGIGVLALPTVLTAVRAYAEKRRELAEEWGGVQIPARYAEPPKPRPGIMGRAELTYALLRDPGTWRDLRWLCVDVLAGAGLAILAPALLVQGLLGLVVPLGLWQSTVDDGGIYWYTFLPVTGTGTALLAPLLGLVWLAVALRWAPALLQAHFSLTRSVLTPSHEELTRRVERLTETRRDAVDASAAELRRIERDLHDGAQARLVAMGMDLGTIEALLDRNPEKAKEMLAEARRSSADALAELRDLVRGIHPPVLAERGLGDAVRALALRMPIATEVTVDLSGRPEAPVESAAYFAVSELLTNAVKHAEADRIWVDLYHCEGRLFASVTDNGRGGASIGAGSGLSGVERRLGTFDGVLAVSSPAGGPTMVTMEIPCVLS